MERAQPARSARPPGAPWLDQLRRAVSVHAAHASVGRHAAPQHHRHRSGAGGAGGGGTAAAYGPLGHCARGAEAAGGARADRGGLRRADRPGRDDHRGHHGQPSRDVSAAGGV
eukprot:scaffold112128_cov60-Phaeocystis_antarctica.AAC.1